MPQCGQMDTGKLYPLSHSEAHMIDPTVTQLQQYAAEAYKSHEASWNHLVYTVSLMEACNTVADKYQVKHCLYLIRHMCEYPSDYLEALL